MLSQSWWKAQLQIPQAAPYVLFTLSSLYGVEDGSGSAPCKEGHLDEAPRQDGQPNALWQLTMHPSELSSGLPVARLSHQSACSCLISDSPLPGDGLSTRKLLTCWLPPISAELHLLQTQAAEADCFLPH